MSEAFSIDFPESETLGFLAAEWIYAHCSVPDGYDKGTPFDPSMWQLQILANNYRVKRSAKWVPERPVLAPAFVYRRSLVVAPQKTGKGPLAAAITLFEAAGPCVFAGWAAAGAVYRCKDHGCTCNFEYPYEPGDAMGMPRNTSLIQLVATSEEQVDNVYRPLQSMIRGGVLDNIMKTGEQFVRLPNNGKIEAVTSSAMSRLGNPINFASFDESGIYTVTNKMVRVAETMRRGLAGMGGRSIEWTNPWDPGEDSTAQRSYESRSTDIYRFYRKPPPALSYKNKVERAKIHKFVYEGSPWVDLNAIESEAAELLEADPAQAERFFGNRIVAGSRSWLQPGQWESRKAVTSVRPRTKVCAGFDGSETNDVTGIRLETLDFYQFTPRYFGGERETVWDPRQWEGRVPRPEVHRAWEDINNQFEIVRAYCDPFKFETELDEWKAQYGDKIFFEWRTNRISQMHASLERFKTDVIEPDSKFSHDGCETTGFHVRNAVERARPGQKYILGKATEEQKIDLAMSSVLAHEAAADAVASGANNPDADQYVYVF